MRPAGGWEAAVRTADVTNGDRSFFGRVSRLPGSLDIGSDPRAWSASHERLREVFGTRRQTLPAFAFTTHRVAACEEGDGGWEPRSKFSCCSYAATEPSGGRPKPPKEEP